MRGGKVAPLFSSERLSGGVRPTKRKAEQQVGGGTCLFAVLSTSWAGLTAGLVASIFVCPSLFMNRGLFVDEPQ